MHPSGILVLTTHISTLCKGDVVARILSNVKKLVKSTLYVHLNNVHDVAKNNQEVVTDSNSGSTISKLMQSSSSRPTKPHTFHADVLPFVTKFYSEAALHCGHLDVNVFLHNIGETQTPQVRLLPQPVQCIMVDLPKDKGNSEDAIRKFISINYKYQPQQNSLPGSSVELIRPLPVYNFGLDGLHCGNDSNSDLNEEGRLITKVESVVLGGTFDHLHSGHKVLLSESILMASKKIVIGLSDGPLLERKTLKELIQPVFLRKKLLEQFILSVARSGISLHIESIYDPYGPSITDPDLQMILVSKETEKGGHMVNDKRLERGLSKLEVHVIGQGSLLEDSESDGIPFEEKKASSSNVRFRLLGTLLKPGKDLSLDFIQNASITQPRPYIIGLTGGIAAGKSSVASKMEKHGAKIIDCDKLGHKSYTSGSRAYTAIVEHFGEDIISSKDGSIDRRKLGEKVFSDKSQLVKLNSIVWPEIEKLCKEEINNHLQATNAESGSTQIYVLDAAVLLEANWNDFVHEVWVVNVPAPEAVKRIVDRNNISEENARKRIESQATNEWRTERANVILSTLWLPSVTEKLVSRAWDLLKQRVDRRFQNATKSHTYVKEQSHKL